MLHNYLSTFLRILVKQKIYSIINVTGLAIGIAASLLIVLYSADEISYDRFHKDANRIYRLNLGGELNGEKSNFAMVGGVVAKSMIEEIAGIESFLRIVKRPVTPVEVNERTLSLDKLILADSNFFDFFNFELLAGEKRTALSGPNKIVLTESAARSVLGADEVDPTQLIGKTIFVGVQKVATEITGIAANPPDNSHFHFNSILSSETDLYLKKSSYSNLYCYTYLKLAPGKKIDEIEAQIPTFYNKYVGPEIFKLLNVTLDEWKKSGNYTMFTLQPLVNIHLNSHLLSEMESNGNASYLVLLGIIAAFILILACINFMNLATARATNRAREVGVRKAVGALQKRLIGQFMFESFIYTLLALILGLALVSIFISPFNFLADKNLSINQLGSPEFILGIISALIVITVLAGSYPAFYISAFKPAIVLKGKLISGARGYRLRNSLVIFQFVISTSLIIATILVYQQLRYMQSLSLGFDKENTLCLNNSNGLGVRAEAFKDEIKQYSDVIEATFTTRLPSEIVEAGAMRRNGDDQLHTTHMYNAGFDYIKTLNLSVQSGRDFSKEFPGDSNAVIVNETAAMLYGFNDLSQKEFLVEPNGKVHEVIAIVKDFNFESLLSSVKPLVIFFGAQSRMIIRFTPGSLQNKVSAIKNIWGKYSALPFEYSFLDENLNAQYKSVEQLQSISACLTFLSIAIACFGLLGLVTYMASQRAKEIGVRKILGATVWHVVILLSKDFARLVLIAFVVAVPFSWFAMNEWLETFAYRINFNVTAAFTAGAAVVFIALVTVSYQSVKAARGNPVESLRSE